MKIEILINNNSERGRAASIISCLSVSKPVLVTIKGIGRTTQQNASQWPILAAFAAQIKWPVNGEMQYLTADEWKDLLSCAFRKECPRIAEGLDGGSVLLGMRTSKFEKDEWPLWVEYLNWAASEKGVKIPINKSQEARYML